MKQISNQFEDDELQLITIERLWPEKIIILLKDNHGRN